MRIVIDLQAAQAGSRFRGIGRYSLPLAKAMAQNAGQHQIFIALNGLFPDTIESIRASFDGLLPSDNIRVWDAHGPVDFARENNNWRRRTSELIREAFLASLAPDVVLVSSLFEGCGDQTVTSVGMLGRTLPTAIIIYDLIPLIHRKRYLENPAVEAWYENKLGHVRRADLLLAISESSRQEAIKHLNFPADAVISISAAAESSFKPQAIKRQREAELRNKFGLHRPFVMYTAGIDHRKNIEGLIRGYATLPKRLRTSHQLAIVCSIKPQERQNFELLAKACGLRAHSLVLTDFVDKEELIGLYNLCKLFVLPSWHEGFGLPALEAMSCGRAVIGANTTSLPEVIGREDALFDPHSDTAIAEKMKQVLDNEAFRKDLERHGLKQARKFSWEKSAQRALAALQSLHETCDRQHTQHSLPARRPRLAYVSPLPPEPSGISFYSAELLPELSRHYEIDVVVAQDPISDPWILANCPIRQIDDFKENSHTYDRVLYHFGNSEFHRYMFDLIEAIPGAVVLHDFFLSGLLAHLDLMGFAPGSWASALYHAHGYGAVAERFHATDVHAVIWKYPANFAVLRNARGIIVHSEYSRFLAREWYGESAAHDWKVVPHLRVPAIDIDRCAARSALGIAESDFVVCSFGLVNPSKLHHRIVDAWLASKLAPRADCKLIFVGENDGGEYGEALMAKIEGARVKGRIRITGWVDVPIFRQYLAAADTSVQLRTNSRGETSGSALDSMNFGCATIVNAHGSLAELSDSCVWKLPENFTDVQLIKALETLWREPPRRRQIGTGGRKFIEENQSPRYCADRYAEAIEDFYADIFDRHSLVGIIANLESSRPEISDLRAVATAIAQSLPWQKPARQFLLDISATGRDNLEMQTQSVTRTLVQDLIGVPPVGYRVEPVYLSYEGARCHYRYARNYTMRLLGCPDGLLNDDIIETQPGDVLLALDMEGESAAEGSVCLDEMHRHGVRIYFMVRDLQPLLMPQMFAAGAAARHETRVRAIARYDGAVCVSRAVANELETWLVDHGPARCRPFFIGWSHNGTGPVNSFSSLCLPEDNSAQMLLRVAQRPSFLMMP